MKSNLIFSIITVSYNASETIEDLLKSVLNQTYPHIEHIIMDGGSTDGTLEIIKKYEDKISKWISEPDKGIYDAMNKGVKLASGDVVGILNSDDLYADEFVIEEVVKEISQNNSDSCYGDLVYVDKKNTDKVIRSWQSGKFSEAKYKRGWMPPHPTFFVKKSIYEKYGMFNLDFPIAADYEIMLRFLLKYKISICYLPKVLVKMRIGGKSNKSLSNIAKANLECYKAWKINGINPNPITFVLKPLSKVFQYIK